MTCLDNHLSDDITALSTEMKTPAGSSTSLESSLFSTLFFLIHPLLLVASLYEVTNSR